MRFVILDNDDLEEAKEIRGIIQGRREVLASIWSGCGDRYRGPDWNVELERLQGYIGDLDTAIEEWEQGPPADGRGGVK